MPTPSSQSKKLQAVQMLSSSSVSVAPLGTAARMQLEPRARRNLSAVQVFSGPAANSACKVMGARAFCVGDAIVIGDGMQVESPQARNLIAHELAHNVLSGGYASSRDEEAELAAAAAVARTIRNRRP